MTGTTADLDKAIKAVCPIIGVSLGKLTDRSTWRIQYLPQATQAQKDAALAVMATFTVDESPTARMQQLATAIDNASTLAQVKTAVKQALGLP